ncbi:MAG: hypothetical protein SGILL_010336, partial [Bacillariaceae sp.]
RAERLLQAQEPYRNPSPQVLMSLPYQKDETFLPFTIRDARRTVPTQIPFGFEVFDLIDVGNPRSYYSIVDDDNVDDDNVNSKSSEDIDPLIFPAPLFHNGHPVSYPYNVSNLANATGDCQEYSMPCYRASLIQVMRYLLEAPRFRKVSFFFYMESDHTLCTTLAEIRSIAYNHERYLIAAGTGTSGWIMSRQFLQDFYECYRKAPDESLFSQYNVTRQDLVQPDVAAAVMLRSKRIPWSVTRRYLTSHTVLTSTEMGVADMSLTELFEFEKPDEDGNGTVSNTTDVTKAATAATVSVNGNVNAANSLNATENMPDKDSVVKKKGAVEMLPPLVPKKHLPRCLEPHYGIFDSKDGSGRQDQEDDGLPSFDLVKYDYNSCPDALVFPCKQ